MSQPNSARSHRHIRHLSDIPLLSALAPVPEWRPSARSPVFVPASAEHSFEDSERSTLPSAQPSARLARRKVIPSLPQSPLPVWSLAREVSGLAALRSYLLQWTFANGAAQQSANRFDRRAEEEVFDRGLQVQEALQDVLRKRNDAAIRPKAHVLRQVLEMETDSLAACEDDVLEVSAHLQELEQAAISSLHRLPLEVDEKSLLRHLGVASQSLRRIHEHFSQVVPDLPELTSRMEMLSDIVQEERTEVMQALVSLAKLRNLYEEEKEVLTDLVNRRLQK